jgi:hypothetical protein
MSLLSLSVAPPYIFETNPPPLFMFNDTIKECRCCLFLSLSLSFSRTPLQSLLDCQQSFSLSLSLSLSHTHTHHVMRLCPCYCTAAASFPHVHIHIHKPHTHVCVCLVHPHFCVLLILSTAEPSHLCFKREDDFYPID